MENGLGRCVGGFAERAASAAQGIARVANAGESESVGWDTGLEMAWQ